MLRTSRVLRDGVLESPVLASIAGLTHGFTTRRNGSASGIDSEPGAADALAAVLAHEGAWRRRQVVQVHGATVAGPRSPDGDRADAMVTDLPGELLVIRTADCLALLLAAVDGGRPLAVAAIHAGWRGLVGGVIDRAIDALVSAAPGAQLFGALGPAIGPCCFEVGPEVAASFREIDLGLVSTGSGDRSFVDLPGAGALAARRRGVALDPESRPPCTRCRPDLFHSYRAHGGASGRMAAVIGVDAVNR